MIEAVDEAEVRARVRGFVEEIKFAPGQQVTEGDLLYLIEPDQYQAAVNSAKAAVAVAEATISVANALVKTAEAEVTKTEQDRSREQLLLERNAGSKADVDAAVAANESAKAALDSAKANVEAAIADKERVVASLEKAQLDLDYTEVQSPITGTHFHHRYQTGQPGRRRRRTGHGREPRASLRQLQHQRSQPAAIHESKHVPS